MDVDFHVDVILCIPQSKWWSLTLKKLKWVDIRIALLADSPRLYEEKMLLDRCWIWPSLEANQ